MKMKVKFIICLFVVFFSTAPFAQTSQEQSAAQKAWDQKMMQTYGLSSQDLSDYRDYVQQSNENLQKAQDQKDQQVASEVAQYQQQRDQAKQQAIADYQPLISQTRAQAQENLQNNLSYLKTLPDAKNNPNQAIENVQKMLGHQYQLKQAQDSISQSCNCYDTSDPNNFSSNFLYNEKHERVQRKSPPCRCLPSTSTVSNQVSTDVGKITTIQTQPAVILKSSTDTQTPIQPSSWKIDYN